MALSTRYSWSYITPPDGGVQIILTCQEEDLRVDDKGKRLNTRSPKAGAKTYFPSVNTVMPTPYDGIQSLESHMQTLTDDQCDSFYPQERVKKKKSTE